MQKCYKCLQTSKDTNDNCKITFYQKSNTYICLVFSTKSTNNCCEKKFFFEGNTTQGHKHKIKHFNHIFSTSYKRKLFLTIKSPNFSKKYIIFFERIFYTNFFKARRTQTHLPFFLVSCIFKLPSTILVTSSNVLAIMECFASRCFINSIIPLVLI